MTFAHIFFATATIVACCGSARAAPDQNPANTPPDPALVISATRHPRWYESTWKNKTPPKNEQEKITVAKKELEDTNRAAVGDTIEIDVRNLDQFLAPAGNKPRHWPHELVPYLDGIPLPKIYPSGITHDKSDPSRVVTHLIYTLDYTQDTKANWVKLLRRSGRDVEVTVGLENGDRVLTQVHSFRLLRVLWQLVLPASIGVLITLIIFLFLAKRTDIVRDLGAPRRPDNTRPYSLGRSQMAFWFFIIVASFLFLFIATGGSTQTLNSQVLLLMGISASAGFGALLADRINPDPVDPGENVPAVNLNQSRRKVVAELQSQQVKLKSELEEKSTAQGAVNDEESRRKNADELAEVATAIKKIDIQIAYFEVPAWRAIFLDLLTERGHVSFHRFQMLGWTLILGGVFIAQVIADLAMPAFDAALLGLMGIVGTTYVGFKFPQPPSDTPGTPRQPIVPGGQSKVPPEK